MFVASHDEHITLSYVTGEGTSYLFGGNSNWRGPIWFPINYFIVEALERYHHSYGNKLKVECPIGSQRTLTLGELAQEVSRRLSSIFLQDVHERRLCHGDVRKYSSDPRWRDLVLFHEYFHGETGRGLGASHQTGWTVLAARVLENAVENSATNRKANSDDLMTSRLPKHIPTRHFRVPGEVNDVPTAL